jgi:hypothetical protein
MRWPFRLALAICVGFTGCAPVGVPPGGQDKYGCEEPPPDTFTSAGVDIHFAQSTFPKIITGAVDIKTNPSVISSASQAIQSARIRDKIRCLAVNRDKFNAAQTIYLDQTNAFLETKPTPEDFIKWQQQNPFPAHSEEQIKLLEREVNKLRENSAKSDQELRAVQERVKDRRLTGPQLKSIVSALSKEEKGEIDINFVNGSAESERFADDIALALRISGWAITGMGSTVFLGGTPVGLQIVTKDPQLPSVQRLLSALLEIDPKTQVRTNPNMGRTHLNVGSKP